MRDRREIFYIPIVLFATIITYWGVFTTYHYALDDAYITYRYARNISSGLGFVYNPNEFVLGTTTPLYTLLLGGLGLISDNFELLSHWLGVLGWFAAAFCIFMWLSRLQLPLAGFIAGIFVSIHPAILHVFGMETPLLIGLMFLCAWLWSIEPRKRVHYWLIIIVSACLLLIRQDSALWLFFLGLESWRKEGRLPWREGIGTVAITSPWFIFAAWKFGTILPNSALAKIGQTTDMCNSGDCNVAINYWNLLFMSESTLVYVLFAGAVGLGLWAILHKHRQLWWVIAWLITYLLIYVNLNVVSFSWYLVPPITCTFLIAGLGLSTLFSSFRKSENYIWGAFATTSLWANRSKAAVGFVLITLFAATLFNQSMEVQNTRNVIRKEQMFGEYREAGLWLAEHAPKNTTIGMIEIGIIGYHVPNTILDTMGLVSPDMRLHQTGWTDTLVYAINAYRPEYFVVLKKTAWEPIQSQWWFSDFYESVAEFGETALFQRTKLFEDSFSKKIDLHAEYMDGLAIDSIQFQREELSRDQALNAWIDFDIGTSLESAYQITTYLVDTATDERFALETEWPFGWREAYPADHWQSGETISVPVQLAVPDTLQSGTYRLGIFLYDSAQNRGVPLLANPEADYPEVQAGYFRLENPPVVAEIRENFTTLLDNPVSLVNGINLVQLEIPSMPIVRGDLLPLSLQWHNTQHQMRDLTVFIHVLDQNGSIVAQIDRRPFAGRFPTASWKIGEMLQDEMLLQLPKEMESGSYSIKLGLYDEGGRISFVSGQDNLILRRSLIIQ